MRFVVYGAGAIGGVIGACLSAAGRDVVLVARGAHLQAMRAEGLRLETPVSASVHDIPVVENPADLDLGGDDVVVLAMKTQDTAAALDALRAAAPEVPVVCAQNGVENERLALRRFPCVYGVCVMLPAAHLRPGVVQAFSAPTPGILDVGPILGGVPDDRARELAAGFVDAGFSSEAVGDIKRWKYAKLVMNLGNAVEALCGPESRGSHIAKLARREGLAVLDAAGIEYVGDAEFIARRGNLITPGPIGEGPRPGDSSWQSLARGTGSIETDYLNGEIVLLGRIFGVPTPVNAVLQREANALAAGGRPPGTRNAEDLLDTVRT